jgi:hypothetical protein
LSSRIDIGPSRDDERMVADAVPAVAWNLRPPLCNTRASQLAVILARGALDPPLGKPFEIDVARLIFFLSLLARSASLLPGNAKKKHKSNSEENIKYTTCRLKCNQQNAPTKILMDEPNL